MNIFTPFRNSPILGMAVLVSIVSATAAGAATIHHFDSTASSGSEGASAFTNASAAGSALQGTVASSPDTSFSIPFGVLGEYNFGSQFGIGVVGISSTGYGVAAESLGVNPALLSLAKGSGDGFDVASTSGIGISATSTQGTVIAATTSDSGSQIAGLFISPNLGTIGAALGLDTGEGAIFTGYGSGSGDAVVEVDALTDSSNLLSLNRYHYGGTQRSNFASQTFLVQGETNNRSGHLDMFSSGDVQIAGDVYVTGAVYTGCAAYPATSSTTCDGGNASAAAIRSRAGQTYDAFATRDASATVEDEGETQLIRGASHVDLDRDFASTISTSRPYMVFVTPLGKSKQLYVTNRTMMGFDVREADGQSTVAYDYRIVATAADASRPRMIARAARTATVTPTQNRGVALVAKAIAQIKAEQKSRAKAIDLMPARTR